MGKKYSNRFLDLWALIKAVILPFQGNCSPSPPQYSTKVEHLLHEYELDDETLQKAQLEQHKMFQSFPTSPAPSALLPPLEMDTKPKVPSIQEQDDPDDNSSEALFDPKADNAFLDDNDKPLARTRIYEKILSTHSPSR